MTCHRALQKNESNLRMAKRSSTWIEAPEEEKPDKLPGSPAVAWSVVDFGQTEKTFQKDSHPFSFLGIPGSRIPVYMSLGGLAFWKIPQKVNRHLIPKDHSLVPKTKSLIPK